MHLFWVVNASSGEKSCLQFSVPTGSGVGGEEGVSHSLKHNYYEIFHFYLLIRLHMRHSRPFRPGCDPHYFFFFFFSFKYVMYDHKKWLTTIFRFFENFSGSNGRNRREIRAVIDSFETYTINSLIKKKIFFHHIQSFILGSTTKIKKIKMIFLPTSL